MISSLAARLTVQYFACSIALGLLTSPSLALAQTSAPPSPPSAPAPMQRLFFSAEKRATLDRQRTQNLQQIRSLQGATLNLDGMVQRSSGKSTVWINGQPQNENEAARNGVNVFLSPKTPGRAQIAPGDESPTPMKVGETINRATGERNNRLGNGVVITPDTRINSGR